MTSIDEHNEMTSVAEDKNCQYGQEMENDDYDNEIYSEDDENDYCYQIEENDARTMMKDTNASMDWDPSENPNTAPMNGRKGKVNRAGSRAKFLHRPIESLYHERGCGAAA
jgi:hypothetical protein